jgi:hypothetical protein
VLYRTSNGASTGRICTHALSRSEFLLLALAPALSAADLITVRLRPETAAAFNDYVRKAEARMDAEIRGGSFLWLEQREERLRQARAGQAVIEPWDGKAGLEVPSGIVHDWVGAALVTGATLERTIALVQNYDAHKNVYKPDVIDSKLLSRNGNSFRIYLRLLKKKVLTVVLNTEHAVEYFPLSKTRLYSRSKTTRIAEVDNPGKPSEREIEPGSDHGFLWNINSYWRFEERDGGVYIECRAISLTRDVPIGLGWLVTPIIRNLPRESLESTLLATRRALQ